MRNDISIYKEFVVKCESLRLLLLIPLILSLPTTVSAQVTVRRLLVSEQLPSGSVNRLLQDSEGYIWMATVNGLCRYDAYRAMTFRIDTISGMTGSRTINSLAEDHRGRIWIACEAGVLLLNKRDYSIRVLEDEDVKGKDVKCVYTTRDGSVWVGAGRSAFRYPAGEYGREKRAYNDFGSVVNSFCEDSAGAIWLTTWRAGLYRLGKDDARFVRYPSIGADDNPHKIHQDATGQRWICTWGDGLYRFYPDRDGEEMYERVHLPDKDSLLHDHIFFNLLRDDKYGYIWVLSHAGLYVLKQDSLSGRLVAADVPPSWSRITNLFYDFIKDRDGNLWLGSAGEGVLTIELSDCRFRNYDLEAIRTRTGFIPNITAICEGEDRALWIRQNRLGICLFYPESGRIVPFTDFPHLNNLEKLKEARCIAKVTGRKEMWVGVDYIPVVYCFEQSGDRVILKRKIELAALSPAATPPRGIMEDRRGNVWVFTGNELFRSQGGDGFSLVKEVTGDITGIAEAADSSIWVSTAGQGVYRLKGEDPVSHLTTRSSDLPDDRVSAICADGNGRVWGVASDHRLFSYDRARAGYEEYDTGYLGSKLAIYDLVADERGHLWISGSKQIIEFNPANGAFVNYSSSDGISVNTFTRGAVTKTASGILFGGNHGICKFIPSDHLGQALQPSSVRVCDIKLNNHSIYEAAGGHKLPADATMRLEIGPADKTIEIAFSSLNYMSPDKIRYAYKFEGVDNDWIYAAHDRQFVVYNQLRKGRYMFYVKATDRNGLWSGPPTRIEIVKLPDFYETRWAYLFYVCLAAGGVYGIIRVISFRLRWKNELRIAQIEREKSEELAQTKLRYFTNISHDLMTPLTIMSCVVDEAESSGARLDVLRSNIHRLHRLLRQILDFRKVESGNMKLKVSRGDIISCIRQICDKDFLPLVKRDNIVFSFEAEVDRFEAFFDAGKVDRVIFNLLSNAFKYTPKNGFISVRLQVRERGEHVWLFIQVSDTGIGIPERDLPKIFTRFFNNDIGLGETNGIGLSLTKDLVELHHGNISVESEPGRGTTFTIELPVDRESYREEELCATGVVEVEPATGEETTEAGAGEEFPRANLLLVEDNEELLGIIRQQLSGDYRVYTATNGEEALRVMANEEIDIIVSDVMMPGVDGLELCRNIKGNVSTSHVAVLLLTARSSMDDRVACYDAGADGYISKPFEMKVLKARIHNLVAGRQKRQQEFKSDVTLNISALQYCSLDEKFMGNVIRCIEEQLPDPDFDIESLAAAVSMSKSSLYRKIKSMTSLSPHEFIRNVKLKHACRLLKEKSVTIAEVAYAVGFSNPKYFAACFKAEFGVTPTDYQKKTASLATPAS
ncbi:MAG: response regulator [Odoribacteraceae bacterium]|nr:response regulator [Odoribacteraceae bacterium]